MEEFKDIEYKGHEQQVGMRGKRPNYYEPAILLSAEPPPGWRRIFEREACVVEWRGRLVRVEVGPLIRPLRSEEFAEELGFYLIHVQVAVDKTNAQYRKQLRQHGDEKS